MNSPQGNKTSRPAALAATPPANLGVAAFPFWQPIETAPKDGTRIIVYRPKSNECIPHVGMDYWRHFSLDPPSWARSSRYCPPSHWMPLPDPPVE